MNITTGIDIIEVKRIEEMLNEHGNSFKNRVFTESEINYCDSSEYHKNERFAVRFCAKEAIYKALNVKDNSNINWTDIEIIKEDTGRPFVKLNGELEKYMINIYNIDISLSHIKDTAIASVVISWKEN